MKAKALSFLALFLFSVMIIPIYNVIVLSSTTGMPMKKLIDNRYLNVDGLMTILGMLGYPVGISTDYNQAIIGRNGWLFLGDGHGQVLSESRGVAPINRSHINSVHTARDAWEKHVLAGGALGFYTMVAPNKHTIYSEFLPKWLLRNKDKRVENSTQYYYETSGDNHLVDIRERMKLAKDSSQHDLYYKTDTHWNFLGAWFGYQGLAANVKKFHPDIIFLEENDISSMEVIPRQGGDLSMFLHLQTLLKDREIAIGLKTLIETTHRYYPDGEIHFKGGNGVVEASQKPLLVESTSSLNSLKVLWLRDSFGNALAPYFSATFSSLLQQHWQSAFKNPGQLMKVINSYKPDLVILTFVERVIGDRDFQNGPIVLNEAN